MKIKLRDYIPPKLAGSLLIPMLIDSLTREITTLNTYNWLGGQNFLIDLDTILEKAKSSILENDSEMCKLKLYEFQSKIKAAYLDTLNDSSHFVTTDAWKFSFYHSDYILRILHAGIPQYKLTLLKQGKGAYSVSPDNEFYDSSVVVSIFASGGTASTFTGWKGDIDSTKEYDNRLYITMDNHKTIIGTFYNPTYIMSANSDTNGAIFPSGLDTVGVDSSITYHFYPHLGFEVDSILVDGENVGSDTSFTFHALEENHTIYVKFALLPHFQLHVNDYPLNSGSVEILPDSDSYSIGTQVQLTAIPADDYIFTGWSGDVAQQDRTISPLSIFMNATKTITAKFSPSNFTITTTTEGAGKIVSGTPPVTFNLERPNPAIESGSQTFTAKENESLYLLVLPAEGYDIDTVATDGVRYSAFLTPKDGAGLQDMQLRWPVYMFENIKANHFLHARFKRSK